MVLGFEAGYQVWRTVGALSNIDYARALLTEAETRIAAASSQIRRRRHAYVVRQSQEAVELSLKSSLRLAGIEFPKEHEVGGVLTENSRKYPGWFSEKIPEVARVSRELVQKRIPSMYGDEAGRGPQELFTREDASEALADARMVFRLVGRLFRLWSREKRGKRR